MFQWHTLVGVFKTEPLPDVQKEKEQSCVSCLKLQEFLATEAKTTKLPL